MNTVIIEDTPVETSRVVRSIYDDNFDDWRGRAIAASGGLLCDCRGDKVAEAGWYAYHGKTPPDEMVELAREAAWLLRAVFEAAARVTE